MNEYLWQGVLLLVQAAIGTGVGVAVRSLREIHSDVERISGHLQTLNGRVGRTEQRLHDHEGHCDDRHDRHRVDYMSLRDRIDRVFGGAK